MGDFDWEKLLANLAFVFLLSLGVAWILGVTGLDRPYLERVGVSALGICSVIAVIAEGTEAGFSRCMVCTHEHAEEMPEAEQAMNE